MHIIEFPKGVKREIVLYVCMYVGIGLSKHVALYPVIHIESYTFSFCDSAFFRTFFLN